MQEIMDYSSHIKTWKEGSNTEQHVSSAIQSIARIRPDWWRKAGNLSGNMNFYELLMYNVDTRHTKHKE